MSNIIQFNDGKKVTSEVDVDAVLDEVKNSKLSDVLIIGYTDDNNGFVATTISDIKEMLFMVEEFKFKLMSGEFNEE
jgi:hypothetical protein